jgi:hypothetical protein
MSIVVGFITFLPVATKAQGPPARNYLNVPVYQARFFLDVMGSNGTTAAASDLPLPNNQTITRHGFLTLLWSFPLGNRYGGVAVTGGYARVKVNGPLGNLHTSGLTDPSMTFHANFFGAPALRLEEYPKAIPQTYSSFHLTVNATRCVR